MDFTPISRHGIIGDGSTCALVAEDGSIDWWCVPNPDSSSTFGRIVDPTAGGYALRPVSPATSTQQYEPDTNVLHTEFETDPGAITVTDFVPKASDGSSPARCIYRRVRCDRGTVTVEGVFEPRFDYGQADTTVEGTAGGTVTATGPGSDSDSGNAERLGFASEFPLRIVNDRAVSHETLETGEVRWSVVHHDPETPPTPAGEEELETTIDYWIDWVGRDDGAVADVIEGKWRTTSSGRVSSSSC